MIAAPVTGVLFLLLLAVLVGRRWISGRTDEAIVMARITTVKNSPDAKSTDAFVLHAA